MKRKVLFVATHYPQGGAERQMLLLGQGLLKRGHNVEFFAFKSPYCFYEELLGEIPFTSKCKGKTALFRIIDKLRSFRPHTVITFMPHNGLMVRLATLISFELTVIYSIRNEYSNVLWYLSDLLLQYKSTNVYNNIYAYNQMMLKYRSSVIPNGFVIPKNVRSKSESFNLRIAVVARITPQKNQLEVIEALSLCRNKEQMELRFFGDIVDVNYASLLRQRAYELNLSNIYLEGRCKDIDGLFSNIDVSVLASSKEGCPNVVFESILRDTPVIISKGVNRSNYFNNASVRIYGSVWELSEYLDEYFESRIYPDNNEVKNNLSANYSLETMVNAYEGLL